MSRIRALLAVLLISLLCLLSLYFFTSQDSKSLGDQQILNSEPQLLEFLEWMQKYHKNYQTAEEFDFRYKLWRQSREKVLLHNSQDSQYRKGLNHFADLTQEEIAKLRGGNVIEGLQFPDPLAFQFETGRQKDWRDEGAVTSVKSQGVCQSGYAFAAIGALEGLNFIYNKNLLTFSTQQIIDCTHPTEQESCQFGYISDGFNYLVIQNALLEADYPYEAIQKKCTPNVSLGIISIRDHQPVRQYTLELMNAVDRQPIAVYIDPDTLHDYQGDIIKAQTCGTSSNHGVLVIGYNTQDPNNSYWIIKNSWSYWWGEKGYARLQLGPNTCGILNSMSFPEF